MDFDEYRKRGKEMVDYIADYLENIRDRRVLPNVKPGYMRNLLPDSAPIEGEDWDKIFSDVERVIMPGVTHWQSPHMHAYFPALNSFPSLLGDMLADAINCLGFTWASSPACTELETIVMNWLGKMIGLPDEFLHTGGNSKGGGVIQTTASEATLVCLLAGRTLAIKRYHEKTPGYQDAEINARLVAYCSDQAHSSVEKAALIGLVRMRYIESDANLSQRGSQLCDAIESDIKEGLIPFWVCATLGTTGACAFDNLVEVGNVCRKYNLWLHVDAAYAGSAFICPEYRIWLKGIEKADSIAFNPSKWLMVHFDCTAMWVKDSTAVHRTFNVEPLYLQHENSGLAIDYMHWQIPLSKRFRALKLWFVLRSYGIKGLQQHIREGVRLAQKFEALVLGDFRFEIPAVRHLGMVVFRIKGENDLTERLLKRLNHRGNLHCVPASLKGKYVIRFTVTSTRTTSEDILSDWAEIREVATELLEELDINLSDRAKVSLKDTREKNEAFGSSLLLANTPMSPKIVNGSFAAIFDTGEFLEKAYAGIRIAHQDSPSMRRRVRGILMSGKQFSLDSRMDLVVHSCLDSGQQGGNNNDNRTASIREDSEDLWEAYENLGTPPRTPSPLVSPLYPSTPSRMKLKTYNSAPFLQVPRAWKSLDVNPDRDRVRNNNPSNISTARNKARTVDSTVYVQQMDKVVSFSRCRDSQCASSSNLIAGRGQPRRKKFHDQNQQPAATSRHNIVPEQHPDRNRASEAAKRYAYAAKSASSHSFYNRGFRGVPHPKRREFQNNVYATGSMPDIDEFCFEDEVDWKGLRSLCGDKDTKRLPKIRVRVQDETGHRVRTAFDASSDESSPTTARNEMNMSLLQYLDCDEKIVRKQTRSSDERTTCCKKCGHHRTVAQAS